MYKGLEGVLVVTPV